MREVAWKGHNIMDTWYSIMIEVVICSWLRRAVLHLGISVAAALVLVLYSVVIASFTMLTLSHLQWFIDGMDEQPISTLACIFYHYTLLSWSKYLFRSPNIRPFAFLFYSFNCRQSWADFALLKPIKMAPRGSITPRVCCRLQSKSAWILTKWKQTLMAPAAAFTMACVLFV